MMVLSVATTVLVTQQPSVVVKGMQPDIIPSMAQEGETQKALIKRLSQVQIKAQI